MDTDCIAALVQAKFQDCFAIQSFKDFCSFISSMIIISNYFKDWLPLCLPNDILIESTIQSRCNSSIRVWVWNQINSKWISEWDHTECFSFTTKKLLKTLLANKTEINLNLRDKIFCSCSDNIIMDWILLALSSHMPCSRPTISRRIWQFQLQCSGIIPKWSFFYF